MQIQTEADIGPVPIGRKDGTGAGRAGLLLTFAGSSARGRSTVCCGRSRNSRDRLNVWPILALAKPPRFPSRPRWYLSFTRLPLTFDLSPMEIPDENMETCPELGWANW